ncbi:hypothetical protein [Streptomyces sp. NPDC001380]
MLGDCVPTTPAGLPELRAGVERVREPTRADRFADRGAARTPGP